MKKMVTLLFAILLCVTSGWGQAPGAPGQRPKDSRESFAPELQDVPEAEDPGDIPDLISIPAGTRVPMTIVRAPQEGEAHEGAKVYLRTRVPLRADGGVVIPARSLVVGVLTPGYGFGPAGAGLSVRLRTIVLRNNYRMPLSGRVIGSISAPGGPAKPTPGPNGLAMLSGLTPEQLAAIGTFALAGGELGYAFGRSQKGTMIGSLVGAGIGMAAMLAANGSQLHLHVGTNVDGVLDEPLALDSRYLH